MNLDLLVKNVSDLARSTTWIGLDVDSLKWILEVNISEGDPSNTSMTVSGRNRADGHTNTKHHISVSNEDILRATILGHFISIVAWLDGNSIVIVSDIHILNQHIGTVRVDTISVERHGGPGKLSSRSDELLPDWQVLAKTSLEKSLAESKELVLERIGLTVTLGVTRALLEDIDHDLHIVNIDGVNVHEVHVVLR